MYVQRPDDGDREANQPTTREADERPECSERNGRNTISHGAQVDRPALPGSQKKGIESSSSTHGRTEFPERNGISPDHPKARIEALNGYGIRTALSATTGAPVHKPFGQASYDPEHAKIPFEAQCPITKNAHPHRAWFNDDERTIHCWECNRTFSYLEAAASIWECTLESAAERLWDMMPGAEHSTFEGCRVRPWFVDRANRTLPSEPAEVVGLPYRAEGPVHILLERAEASAYCHACRRMSRGHALRQAAHGWYIGLLLETGRDELDAPFSQKMRQNYKQIYNGVEMPWLIEGMSITKILKKIRKHSLQRITLAKSKRGVGVDVKYVYGKIGGRFIGRLETTSYDRPTSQMLTTIHHRDKEELEIYAAKMGNAAADALAIGYRHPRLADHCEGLLDQLYIAINHPERTEAARLNAIAHVQAIVSMGVDACAGHESEYVVHEDPESMTKVEIDAYFASLHWPGAVRNRYGVTVGEHTPTGDRVVVIPVSSNGEAQFVCLAPEDLGGSPVPSSPSQQPALFGLRQAHRGHSRSTSANARRHICIFADPREVIAAAAIGCKGVGSSHGPKVWRDEWSGELAEKGYNRATILFPNHESERRHAMRVAVSLEEAGVAASIARWPDEMPEGTNVAMYVTDPGNREAKYWSTLKEVKREVRRAVRDRRKAASGAITEIVADLETDTAGHSALRMLPSRLEDAARHHNTEVVARSVDELRGAGYATYADRLQEAVNALREADTLESTTSWKLEDAIKQRKITPLIPIAEDLKKADLLDEAKRIRGLDGCKTKGLRGLIKSAARVTF